MDENLFLRQNDINQYNLILETIINKGWTEQVLSIENIGDIVSILNYNDKKRKDNDPELKKAVFTIIRGILDSGKVEIFWKNTWVESVRRSPPKTQEELFIFLNDFWDKDDGMGLGKEYLLWFKKK